jgi:hypothetical protein
VVEVLVLILLNPSESIHAPFFFFLALQADKVNHSLVGETVGGLNG